MPGVSDLEQGGIAMWIAKAIGRQGFALAAALLLLAAPVGADQRLTIAALGETSDTFQLAVGWSGALLKAGSPVKLTPLNGGGSVKVMRGVAQSDWDIGFLSSPHYLHAIKGKKNFKKDPPDLRARYKKVRALFGITSGFGMYVVRADSGIKGIRDLKGKKVALGRPGGGGSKITPALFKAHGIIAEKDFTPEFLQPTEGFDEMRNGRLDLVAAWGGIPQAAVYSFSRQTPVRFLSLDRAAFKAFQKSFPGGSLFVLRTYSPEELKQGYGDGLVVDGPVNFFTFQMQVITRANVPEEAVYQIIKVFWEQLDAIKRTSAQLSNLNRNDALEGLSAPLHPGAERYYRERGWLK